MKDRVELSDIGVTDDQLTEGNQPIIGRILGEVSREELISAIGASTNREVPVRNMDLLVRADVEEDEEG